MTILNGLNDFNAFHSDGLHVSPKNWYKYGIVHFVLFFNILANSVDPDEMPPFGSSLFSKVPVLPVSKIKGVNLTFPK